MDIYAACDRAIQELNRLNLKSFGKLKLASFDQLNVIRTVTELYRKSAKEAARRYYEVAFEAYLLMMAECGIPSKEAHKRAEEAITEEWVEDILTEPDFVTQYRFDTETERKAQRLIEALAAVTVAAGGMKNPQTEDRNAMIDAALRYWSKQLGQYAINVTDYAAAQAMEDAGILRVRWETAKDERVCAECHQLDGRIFRIDSVPRKPHWNCRCTVHPVR